MNLHDRIRSSRTLPLVESIRSDKYAQALTESVYGLREAKQQKTLRFMIAAPGSGKTTHITKNYPDAVVASADHHPGLYGPPEKKGGPPSFDHTKLPDAHAAAQKKAGDAMAKGHPHVIVDNTNTAAWQIAPYLKHAAKHGYKIAFDHVHAPLDQIRKRGVHFPTAPHDPSSEESDNLADMKKGADDFAAKLHSLKNHPNPMKALDKEGAFHAPWEGDEEGQEPRSDHSYTHGLKHTIKSYDASAA